MTGDITPISFKILSVVSDCEIKSRVRSHTFRIKSAFFIHDKVDLNASIRSVGISLMKPTVSKKTTSVFRVLPFAPSGRVWRRVCLRQARRYRTKDSEEWISRRWCNLQARRLKLRFCFVFRFDARDVRQVLLIAI